MCPELSASPTIRSRSRSISRGPVSESLPSVIHVIVRPLPVAARNRVTTVLVVWKVIRVNHNVRVIAMSRGHSGITDELELDDDELELES